MVTHVPNRKSEHSAQFMEATLTPVPISFEQDLGIRVAGEAHVFFLQFLANFGKVVDLAVIDDPVSSFRISHSAGGQGGQIRDGETPGFLNRSPAVQARFRTG